jgi:transcriptional regulator with XRE-family HTH domain
MADVRQPEFGRRLRELRLDRGIKQTELAGGPVSASYISRLEMGNRLPSPNALSYLAATLGVTVDDLIARHEREGGVGAAASAPVRAAGADSARSGLLARATTALRGGDTRYVVELLESELVSPDPEPFGWGWHLLGTLAEAYGRAQELQSRVDVLRLMLAISSEWEDAGSVRGGILADLSSDERALGRLEAALEAGRQAVAATRDSRATERAPALMALAAAETEAGAAARAAERVPEMLALVEAVPSLMAAQVYWTCAGVRGRLGHSDECDDLMNRALETLDSRDDLLAWARLRMAAGALRLRGGRLDDVGRWIEEAGRAIDLVGGPAQAATLLSLRAWLLWAETDYEQAFAVARQADETGLLTFHDRLRARLLQSRCLLPMGRKPDALKAMRAVAVQAEEAGYLDLAAEAWKALASALDPM